MTATTLPLLFILSVLIPLATSHGILTIPTARRGSNGPENVGVLINSPQDQTFFNTCGTTAITRSAPVVTLQQGRQFEVAWAITINHASDPGVSVALRCGNQQQFTSLVRNINAQDRRVQVTMPRAASGNCELQWIWTSNEDRGSFISCADVQVVPTDANGGAGGDNGQGNGQGNRQGNGGGDGNEAGESGNTNGGANEGASGGGRNQNGGGGGANNRDGNGDDSAGGGGNQDGNGGGRNGAGDGGAGSGNQVGDGGNEGGGGNGDVNGSGGGNGQDQGQVERGGQDDSGERNGQDDGFRGGFDDIGAGSDGIVDDFDGGFDD